MLGHLQEGITSSIALAGGVPVEAMSTAESGSGGAKVARSLGIAAAAAAERMPDVKSDWDNTVTPTLFPPYLRKAFPESAAVGDGACARDRT